MNEHVVPVTVNRELPDKASAVIWSEPAPTLLTATTLVTGALGVGIAKVRVRTPEIVESVPFVAELKLSVPGVTPVPVRVTGEPVTVAFV